MSLVDRTQDVDLCASAYVDDLIFLKQVGQIQIANFLNCATDIVLEKLDSGKQGLKR